MSSGLLPMRLIRGGRRLLRRAFTCSQYCSQLPTLKMRGRGFVFSLVDSSLNRFSRRMVGSEEMLVVSGSMYGQEGCRLLVEINFCCGLRALVPTSAGSASAGETSAVCTSAGLSSAGLLSESSRSEELSLSLYTQRLALQRLKAQRLIGQRLWDQRCSTSACVCIA